MKYHYPNTILVAVGPRCRPTEQLRIAGGGGWGEWQRQPSYPLDWKGNYTLDTAANCILNRFDNFFTDISFDEEHEKQYPNRISRSVIDNKTGMRETHLFPKNMPFDQALAEHSATMARRSIRLHENLLKCERVIFVCNRIEPHGSFKSFAKKIRKKYRKKVIILNIRHDDNAVGIKKKVRFLSLKIKLIEYIFNDTAPQDAEQWKGNTINWQKVLSPYK